LSDQPPCGDDDGIRICSKRAVRIRLLGWMAAVIDRQIKVSHSSDL
jgi:hypothetical protein